MHWADSSDLMTSLLEDQRCARRQTRAPFHASGIVRRGLYEWVRGEAITPASDGGRALAVDSDRAPAATANASSGAQGKGAAIGVGR